MVTHDFRCLEKVLRREPAGRPVLFEFFMNPDLHQQLAGERIDPADPLSEKRITTRGFAAAGYDYATMGCGFGFPRPAARSESTLSLNEGVVITDRASFDAYPWPDVDSADYTLVDQLAPTLAEGMKFIGCGPGGVLENVIRLVGYDNLCFMLADDPGLVEDIFAGVGSRLVRHYEILCQFDSIGALISNDDWGFKTQTMLAPEDMRRHVFPWHKRIVETIHAAGLPAILHSCGNLREVMDDIIDDLGYDAKHSYEDNIQPVEEAYEEYGRRIAILGGLDLDFICRSTPEAVTARAEAMLARTADRGGYALGSGNSIPAYVPADQYLAMIRPAQRQCRGGGHGTAPERKCA
jgi:uroporphyrinogen decarboxylase